MKIKKCVLLVFVSFFFLSCVQKNIVIPFELVNNRIVLTATIQGVEGRYFFDTGADVSQTDASLADLSVVTTGIITNLGVNESHTIHEISEITIHDKKIKTKSFIANNSQATAQQILIPERLNGVLGLLVFDGYWCEISFSENTILLGKQKPSGYSKRVSADFENYKIIIPAKVNGQEARMALDTGYPDSIGFHTSTATKNDTAHKEKVLTMGTSQYLVFCDVYECLGLVFKDICAFTDSPDVQTGLSGGLGALGLPFLKGLDIAIDLTRSRTANSVVILTRHNSLGSIAINQSARTEFGLYNYYYKNNGLLVSRVRDGSPCAQLGIIPHTLITHVNGKPLGEQIAPQTEQIVWNPPKGTVFTIKKGPSVIHVTYKE